MPPAPQTKAPKDQVSQIIKEYEDFAYIVSHDLNAPLRHVKEFTRLLIGMREDNLTEDEREYVSFLEQSLQKLDDMQTTLLDFSRLNTRIGQLREVNFNHVVTAGTQRLDDSVKCYDMTIECDELPTLIAEPKHMELLFFNLIENALKFHESETAKRKVVISAKDQGHQWLFEVKDNGIGIHEDNHEEVLRLFKRLNHDKYKGIGAGLAIAHKIIQGHGGERYIKSKLGHGTSIFFSIVSV